MCETERAQDGTRAGSQHQREQRMDVTRLQSKPTHQEREIRESLNSPGGELYKSRGSTNSFHNTEEQGVRMRCWGILVSAPSSPCIIITSPNHYVLIVRCCLLVELLEPLLPMVQVATNIITIITSITTSMTITTMLPMFELRWTTTRPQELSLRSMTIPPLELLLRWTTMLHQGLHPLSLSTLGTVNPLRVPAQKSATQSMMNNVSPSSTTSAP